MVAELCPGQLSIQCAGLLDHPGGRAIVRLVEDEGSDADEDEDERLDEAAPFDHAAEILADAHVEHGVVQTAKNRVFLVLVQAAWAPVHLQAEDAADAGKQQHRESADEHPQHG